MQKSPYKTFGKGRPTMGQILCLSHLKFTIKNFLQLRQLQTDSSDDG